MSILKKTMALLLSGVLLFSALPVTAQAAGKAEQTLIGDVAVGKYTGDEAESFIKISHPDKPASQVEYDPLKQPEMHADEVFADGLVDYIANTDKEPPYGIVGVPGVDKGANGQGDRGQTYAWASYAYGDWMYVSTLYNSTSSTSMLLGFKFDEGIKDVYGDDMFFSEPDGKEAGSTLCKINVKTGEVKIIMSRAKNGLETSFRNAVRYRDKLYFCGSVNHLPSIYEVDPETDAFQCVYQDPSMRNYPGGPGEAWKEARRRRICPTIRGLTEFNDYLVISTVGMDGNPYIAVSNNPSSGEFTQIAWTWKDEAKTIPGELFGYPACRIQDSIMGGSIWEMIEYNDKLYVAIATGTPENAPDSTIKVNDKGEEVQIIKDMQSFALVSGECRGDMENPDDWVWKPIVGDKERDGAMYTFGIDPERKRSSACNLVVYQDRLYIGEYNDTQIAFVNAMNGEFDYLARNLDQSVSLYRLDKDDHIEKVMGDKTKMFPKSLSGINESGFGRRETQYIWQSRVFDGKLYLGTFDETGILRPIGQVAAEDAGQMDGKALRQGLKDVASKAKTAPTTMDASGKPTVWQAIREAGEFYAMKRETGKFADFTDFISDDPNVLLPDFLFDQEPLVKVDSPAKLYLAMLSLADLLRNQEEWGVQEQLAAKVRFIQLYEQITAYLDSDPAGVPSVLKETAKGIALPSIRKHIKDMKDVLMYMKNSISGFDMYVTEDGEHFQQITRTGLGDPYNHGLRTFAANDDPNNQWMAIGTANPFYGTQIWRMESRKMNLKPVDPDQIDVEVRFVDQNGHRVQREWDKAGQIYVDEGKTSIATKDLEILVPAGYELSHSQSSAKVVKENGVWSVTIELYPEGTFQEPKVKGSNDAATGKPHLKWEPIPGAEQYEIYRATSKNGEYERYYTTSKTSYTNTTAAVGRTYYYRVRAVNGTEKSIFSNTVERTCDCARPDVKATVKGGQPYLTWNKVEGAKSYEIWRSTNGGEWYRQYTTTKTNYTNTTATTGNTYSYQVKALCERSKYGDSAYSYVDTVLRSPTVMISTDRYSGKPTLTWDPMYGADEYEIWRRTGTTGEWYRMYTTTRSSYTNTTAVPGVTYYYQVRGISAQGVKGHLSSVRYITCDCAQPDVNASIRNGHPYLTWDRVEGADRYEVWRMTNGGEWVRKYTTSNTYYTNTDAQPGNEYLYTVRALCGTSSYGHSAFSDHDLVVLK